MGGRAVDADMQRTNNITQPLQELYGPVRDDLTIVERMFDDEIAGELPFVQGGFRHPQIVMADDFARVLLGFQRGRRRPA